MGGGGGKVKKDISQTEEKYGKEFKNRRYVETETALLLDYPNKVDTSPEV
jgi:hypothetical protein